MEDKYIKILQEINKNLEEINARQEAYELFSESNEIFKKVDARVAHSTNQIQFSFDRIHDKIFNFNNILIASFMVLGTFPNESPLLELWTVIFPVFNLIFLIYLEIRQMGIHRFASNEMTWTEKERKKFGKKISSQNMFSLLSFGLSLACLIYVILEIF
jgi:hypothetical protein